MIEMLEIFDKLVIKIKNVKLVDMNFTHKLTGIPVGMLHVMNMVWKSCN